eukprot:84357-Amphidinium_carterae.2
MLCTGFIAGRGLDSRTMVSENSVSCIQDTLSISWASMTHVTGLQHHRLTASKMCPAPEQPHQARGAGVHALRISHGLERRRGAEEHTEDDAGEFVE